MLTPVTIMTVDRFPRHNTGAMVKEIKEFVFDDAAIIASCLKQWGLETGMIGTSLGNDPRGHRLALHMKELGIHGDVRLQRDLLGEAVIERGTDAAGIDDLAGELRQLRRGGQAVTGDARLIVDDGDFPTDEAVEQSGFPHIRATYDCNSGHGASVPEIS